MTDEQPPRGGTLGAIELAELALKLGTTLRTACYHPDRVTRESVTTHTVMLAWVATALAAAWYPGLDTGLIALYAMVHDMPEAICGDTPTLRITPAEREAKEQRETAATDWIAQRMRGHGLGAIPTWLRSYNTASRLAWDATDRSLNASAQASFAQQREARFVWAVDKLLPKLVHILDGAHGLREHGVTPAEARALFTTQASDMRDRCRDFPRLLALRTTLAGKVEEILAGAPHAGPPHAAPLLGHWVRAVQHKNDVITEGRLLAFGADGSYEIEDADGFVHYCWPMLTLQAADPPPGVAP